MVYGFFTAATIKTNRDQPPFGKMPNVWAAFGPGSTTAGVPPGPFVNRAVFRGVFDSPASPQPTPPPGTQTFGSNAANDFPSAAIDRAGNIYAVWATPNARTNQFSVWFASSHDHGQNFYGPFEVAKFPAPPVGSAEMPWIAAGDDGRVDIVYYQSNDAGNPNTSNLHWNTMFAQSLNANSREPVFTVSQVSDHIMHFGPICNLGILCPSGTRSLLDFFKVAIAPDGTAHTTFADTGNANPRDHVTYAKQISGPLALTNPSSVTCLPIPPLASVVSRKVHGTAGQKDILLPPAPFSATNPRGVECRTAGNTGTTGFDYKVVFTFLNNITNCGTAGTTGGTVVAGPGANQCTENLNGLPNAQYTTVTLNGVSDVAGNGPAPVSAIMGLLVGDVNASGLVNSTDTSQTQAQSGQPVTGDLGTGNYRKDVNANGLINSTDTSAVQSKSGTGLSPLPSAP
jgi:hypothetical protein